MANYHLLLPFIGDGLVISIAKKLARGRRLLTNVFHFNQLKEYTLLLHEACWVFLDKLALHVHESGTQSTTLNFSEACFLVTLDVMLHCTVGCDSNCRLVRSDYTEGAQQCC